MRTPLSILKQQAAALARHTKGLVEAIVRTNRAEEDDEIIHRFVLVAPALDNYRYELFSITHPITLYPVKILNNTSGVVAPKDRGRVAAMHEVSGLRSAHYLDNESEFVEWLGAVFKSAQTTNIIRALISQSEA